MSPEHTPDASTITRTVRDRYAAAATLAASGKRASCCSPVDLQQLAVRSTTTSPSSSPNTDAGCCSTTVPSSATGVDPITDNLYDSTQTGALPEGAVLASLGCGNPTALAELNAGDVVLDLGSGGGIDVLLSAQRVGPTGKAYGLDMTDEMLALARRNQVQAGVSNVEFLKGHIESIPLPDSSVDVIISNCVINLSSDKATVLKEAFRVLKPGGRLAVSDVLSRGEIPAAIRSSMEAWVGCIAGAMDQEDFMHLVRETGFANASVEATREYEPSDAREFLQLAGLPVDEMLDQVTGRFLAGFVRAAKPL